MFSFLSNTREGAAKALLKGDYATAIRRYRKVLEKNDTDPETYNDLGVALLESGTAAEAVPCFERANALQDNAIHWNNLGRAWLVMGKYAEAMAAFKSARDKDPSDPQPWYNSTVCLREQGQDDAAIAELQALVATFSDHAGAHNDLGCFYVNRGDTEQALAEFTRVIEINPDYVPARQNLIIQLCSAERFPEARPHLDYLAQRGADVKVTAQHGKLFIMVNGQMLYSGDYTEQE